jgi:hypothetical protein
MGQQSSAAALHVGVWQNKMQKIFADDETVTHHPGRGAPHLLGDNGGRFVNLERRMQHPAWIGRLSSGSSITISSRRHSRERRMHICGFIENSRLV